MTHSPERELQNTIESLDDGDDNDMTLTDVCCSWKDDYEHDDMTSSSTSLR
jgi:hypothetical protein